MIGTKNFLINWLIYITLLIISHMKIGISSNCSIPNKNRYKEQRCLSQYLFALGIDLQMKYKKLCHQHFRNNVFVIFPFCLKWSSRFLLWWAFQFSYFSKCFSAFHLSLKLLTYFNFTDKYLTEFEITSSAHCKLEQYAWAPSRSAW